MDDAGGRREPNGWAQAEPSSVDVGLKRGDVGGSVDAGLKRGDVGGEAVDEDRTEFVEDILTS